MEIDESGEAQPIDIEDKPDIMPKRLMKVTDLSQCKIRKYRYHDKFERKQALVSSSAFSIMNENTTGFFGNINP